MHVMDELAREFSQQDMNDGKRFLSSVTYTLTTKRITPTFEKYEISLSSGQKPIGQIRLTVLNKVVGWVSKLSIENQYQKQGLYSLLETSLIKAAKEKGLLFLIASVTNSKHAKRMERNGWALVSTKTLPKEDNKVLTCVRLMYRSL